jgi:hypothetical protein
MAWEESIKPFLLAHSAFVFLVGGVVIWCMHLFNQSRRVIVFIALVVLLVILVFIILAVTREPRSVFEMTSILFLYGVCLFVLLGDLMMWRLNRYLTQWRGEEWTKELDYVYLTIGALGIGGTLNRFDFLKEGTAVVPHSRRLRKQFPARSDRPFRTRHRPLRLHGILAGARGVGCHKLDGDRLIVSY